MGDEFIFYRDGSKDDFWHMGLNTLVKTSADPDTIAGGPKMPFCSEAWDAIARYIYTGLQGASIMADWMERENEMIACCSDETRPVILIVLADKNWANQVYDGSFVMGNMMLAAHSLGLGCIWIHRAKEDFKMAEYFGQSSINSGLSKK